MLGVIDKRIAEAQDPVTHHSPLVLGCVGGYWENLVTFSLLSVPPINGVELPGLPCFMFLADIRAYGVALELMPRIFN